ncbi:MULTISPECIES: MarR family winged helix-turn-helix transcriptional regulator [unclassified Streptomyces]|uniref:MarR family winged helix-turn-helix transcriptional regulator n=1 Tax=unclassified Streptomyces TaxID=2593676 RepID=UPI001660565B|nr:MULTISPECIES: MarR family transcriptional regulator [unclassified Streptomyces]MBD0712340.1 MarR family transcriptional regulator [Streptomyces sp. CBMA291]MBD0716714.1 MarR family transcriptional regulator [Streptomyces sp. CBMA370]
MTTSGAETPGQWWELAALVHGLDIHNNALLRERATKVGLTVMQASTLRALTGPMTLSELAGLMSCEPSNVIVVIDKLEKQGLIERRPHPTDRRAKQLHLTPEGTERRAKLLETLNEKPFSTGLTEQEQDALRSLLRQAIAAAGSAEA